MRILSAALVVAVITAVAYLNNQERPCEESLHLAVRAANIRATHTCRMVLESDTLL